MSIRERTVAESSGASRPGGFVRLGIRVGAAAHDGQHDQSERGRGGEGERDPDGAPPAGRHQARCGHGGRRGLPRRPGRRRRRIRDLVCRRSTRGRDTRGRARGERRDPRGQVGAASLVERDVIASGQLRDPPQHALQRMRALADREDGNLRVGGDPQPVLEVERAVLVDAVRDEDDGFARAGRVAHVSAGVIERVVQRGEAPAHFESGQALAHLLRPRRPRYDHARLVVEGQDRDLAALRQASEDRQRELTRTIELSMANTAGGVEREGHARGRKRLGPERRDPDQGGRRQEEPPRRPRPLSHVTEFQASPLITMAARGGQCGLWWGVAGKLQWAAMAAAPQRLDGERMPKAL